MNPPPESLLDGRWDVFTWVCALSDGDTDEFRAHVGEEGIDHDGPPSEESTDGTISLVAREWAGWWCPVFEPDNFSLRIGARRQADRHDDQSDERDDLDERQPEFKFSEEANTEEIDDQDRNHEDR